jgi:hypothetical protein
MTKEEKQYDFLTSSYKPYKELGFTDREYIER